MNPSTRVFFALVRAHSYYRTVTAVLRLETLNFQLMRILTDRTSHPWAEKTMLEADQRRR